MNFNKIIEYFSQYYYSNLFLIVITIIFLIIGVSNYKQLKELNIITVYGFLSLSQTLFVYFFMFNSHLKNYLFLIENSINIFLVLEFTLLYLFFFLIVKTLLFKRILFILVIIFFLIIIYYWNYTNAFYNNPAQLTVIECFFLMVPTLLYFIELFKYSLVDNLLMESSFWIATGILFLFSTIIPLFLMVSYLSSNAPGVYHAIYSITYIAYSLLFIIFIIGLKCKIKKI